MKIRTVKIIVDVLMVFILILELVPTEILLVEIHFIAGLVFVALFIVHFLLNRKWVASVKKAFKAGKLNQKTKWQYIMDWSLLIVWSLVILTGISAVGYVVDEMEQLIIFRHIHEVSAILGTALIIVHLYQHKAQIRSYIKKKGTVKK
ncbi:MAG: hypothetical protein LBU41_04240 [Clostridiales Family XIII bacterium]|jgi:uncharacterized membrane protein|nr:hypothetical protein [Clostridiales Family XIII bacterium]